MKKFLALAYLASSFAARADELIMPAWQALRMGYRPVRQQPPRLRMTAGLPAHALLWPVRFADVNHSMGNVMAQYQNYGGLPYWHGGCDLRTQAGEEVHTPVSGRLAGGHYSYTTRPDGSNEKFMKPWPEFGSELYFEISITTDDGYRIEFHHIDRARLPAPIVQLLDAGGGRVEAGAVIGYVVHWPMAGVDGQLYHHTHYNLYDPNGVQLNPEFYSLPLDDHEAPQISGAYAVAPDGSAMRIGRGQRLAARPTEIVVAATDRRAPNVYTHTPSFAEVVFASGERVFWDFRERLTAPNGSFPAIGLVFRDKLFADGSWLRTSGDYENNFFLMRLPVPPSAHGAFTVRVGDVAGNLSAVQGALP